MSFRQILHLSLGIVALCLCLGCVSTQQTIVPSLKMVDIPPLQTEQNVELGDTMVSKGKIYTYHGMDLKNQVQAGDGVLLIKFTIAPQRLVAKLEDKNWTYYVGENVTAYDAMLGVKNVFGGLKISKTAVKPPAAKNETVEHKPVEFRPSNNSKPMYRPYALFGNATAVTMTPKPEPIYEMVEVNALDQSGFTQELIYDGRSGDTVKFLYRELSNSRLRAPFTQEVQYDMKQSSIVGFKGARIEIIEANNTHLKYKVITSFPDAL